MVNAISTLVGQELKGWNIYAGTVAAANGCIYGIPYSARQVVKFNLLEKSIINIGPNFGDEHDKWMSGAITGSGVIYCLPCGLRRGILKIDTNTDTVTELDRNLLPERNTYMMWTSCAVALDGCIYCMPHNAHRIMKLDLNNNDAMTSVGDYLGDGEDKYSGTVVGIDGCVYGIRRHSTRVVKYDPINDTTSFVEEEAESYFKCTGNGALGRDGCIYAITCDGEILKINTANNSHCFVGTSVESDHDQHYQGWGRAILGIDGCIYCPPKYARRILKYDPHSDQTSLVGDDFGNTERKWRGGCLASDGIMYYIPCGANRILSIDPWKEYISSLENKMVQYPEQLGCIFHPSDDMPTDTNFDRAVTKFGYSKVLKAFEACTRMHPADQVCVESNLYPFIIAASYRNSDLSVIYYLLRLAPIINFPIL